MTNSDKPVIDIYPHPATLELMGEIAEARYPSQARQLGRQAYRAALEHRIPKAEVEAIITASKRRQAALTMPAGTEPEEVPMPNDVIAEQPWSPSDALDVMPTTRELDARERQLPTGDR